MSDEHEQKRHERETEGYKAFLPIAKKIKAIDYPSKWRIVPDMTDPLRRFTLERDIAWTTLKFTITMKQTYHRGVYNYNERYDFKPVVVVSGLFANNLQPSFIDLDMPVKPRMAKKLMEVINSAVIPRFYNTIEQEKTLWESHQTERQVFNGHVAKVNGLTVEPNRYGALQGKLKNCPFDISLATNANEVILAGTITYDTLAEMAKKLEWGK